MTGCDLRENHIEARNFVILYARLCRILCRALCRSHAARVLSCLPYMSQNREFLVPMNTRVTGFTPEHYLEHPDLNKFITAHFPN